jgi:hypothetical protein
MFAIALLALLWFHIPRRNLQSTICMAVASTLWLFQECIWLGRLGYQNFRSRYSQGMVMVKHSSANRAAEATEVTLTLKKPWKVRPGQYIYLTLPSLRRHHGGFVQAHPYVISWQDESDITLIIQRYGGFSNDLFDSQRIPTSNIVDGPYGHEQPLLDYDKVLFIASGIGVSAHLLAIRALLKAHDDQSARVRRITLLWFLETAGMFRCDTTHIYVLISTGQEFWAKHFLSRLLDMDRRKIFTLVLYIPHARAQSVYAPQSELLRSTRCVRTNEALDLRWYIDKEAASEAGNMMISCKILIDRC